MPRDTRYDILFDPVKIGPAVFGGRRYAEELGNPPDPSALPFRREVAELLPFDSSAILAR